MTIRTLAVLFIGLALSACNDDAPTPTPIGEWGYADPTDRYGITLSLQGSNYEWRKLGLTLETNACFEVRHGTFQVTAEGLVLDAPIQSTCPGDRRWALTYEINQPDNDTLFVISPNDSLMFKRNYFAGRPQIGTLGCFADDGVFTASPLAALK